MKNKKLLTNILFAAVVLAIAAVLLAVRSRSELRTTNTDEHAIAALASMGERSPAIASGTMRTL